MLGALVAAMVILLATPGVVAMLVLSMLVAGVAAMVPVPLPAAGKKPVTSLSSCCGFFAARPGVMVKCLGQQNGRV